MISSYLSYLGRTLMAVDDNWKTFVGRLRKLWKAWYRLLCILGRYGADARLSERFYLAVVQSYLLFGSDTWLVTPRMERTLMVFCHLVTRQIMFHIPK